jgi:hypothetical protein
MNKIGHNGGPMFSRDSGWVAIARAMRDHPLVGFHLFAKPCDPTKGAVQPALAFIDLIMECQWENGTVLNGGKRMEIKRGQVVGAVSWLAHRWNWTPMAVRIWLDKLENDEMIARHVPGAESNKHRGKVATIITLCNYDTYQSATAPQQQTEQQINSKPATNEQQTNNDIYKDNKETLKQEPLWGKRERSAEEIAEADRLAVEAYEAGKRLKGGAVAKSSRASISTMGELDGSRGIGFTNGKLTIVNGTEAAFADEFPGVDLAAVCNKAGPEIARKSYPTYEFACSVIRKWAQIQTENKRTENIPRGGKRTTVDVSSALAARFRKEGN